MHTILKAKEKTDASATNIDMYSIQTSLISYYEKNDVKTCSSFYSFFFLIERDAFNI